MKDVHGVMSFLCVLTDSVVATLLVECVRISTSVAVCSQKPGEKALWTQYINKSLTALDQYPVRVFVKLHVTYLNCSEGRE